MEEIIQVLEKISNEQLKKCKENKTIPSSDVLDIVRLIMTYRFSQPNA